MCVVFVHAGRNPLRQHARLRHVVDALDLDVFEIRPVGALESPTVGKVVEFKAHGVLAIGLELHATYLDHG